MAEIKTFDSSYLVEVKKLLKDIFYNEHNKNNCLLLADFLLSYFNLINTSDYKIDVANWKKVRDDFRNIVIKPNNKIIDVIIEDSYKLYNLIID